MLANRFLLCDPAPSDLSAHFVQKIWTVRLVTSWWGGASPVWHLHCAVRRTGRLSGRGVLRGARLLGDVSVPSSDLPLNQEDHHRICQHGPSPRDLKSDLLSSVRCP